jgi:hypothetical protein
MVLHERDLPMPAPGKCHRGPLKTNISETKNNAHESKHGAHPSASKESRALRKHTAIITL